MSTTAQHATTAAMEPRPAAGKSLPQEYYTSPEIYRRDATMYSHTQWLLVDHASQIPDAGDWLTYQFGDESVIIVRSQSNEINAFYNVCRHRGSLICTGESGSNKLLTCGYHAWTYDLDGQLRPPRFMPEGFDVSDYPLKSCHVRVHDGLIFINMTEGTPPSFESMIGDLRPFLDLHGLGQAKVAVRKRWVVDANWKLNVENFFECYHCRPAHPTYTGVHDAMKLIAFGAGAGSSDGEIGAKYEQKLADWEEETRNKGYFTGMLTDNETSEFFRAASRLPIKDGCVSETLDGTAGSTLMGKFREHDGGQTGLSFNATGTILANNDFALMFRYTPLGPTKTELVVSWLVDEAAVEGSDYDPENISAVWSVTLNEDKVITENNQIGILSDTYSPGVYSTQEQRIADFTQWYLNRLHSFESESATAH